MFSLSDIIACFTKYFFKNEKPYLIHVRSQSTSRSCRFSNLGGFCFLSMSEGLLYILPSSIFVSPLSHFGMLYVHFEKLMEKTVMHVHFE